MKNLEQVVDHLASPKGILPIALATALLAHRSTRIGPLAIGTPIAVLSEEFLKRVVSRRRPRSLPFGRRRSFPSGHSASSAAYFMGLALMAPTKSLRLTGLFLAAGAAAGINVMRVREREHWTSDVISGDVIGALAVGGTYVVLNLLRRSRARNPESPNPA